jgi:hypothetical protein
LYVACLPACLPACSLSTIAFLIIAVCSCGIFGAKNLHPDILRNFTVKALSPLVWTRLAQACELLRHWPGGLVPGCCLLLLVLLQW